MEWCAQRYENYIKSKTAEGSRLLCMAYKHVATPKGTFWGEHALEDETLETDLCLIAVTAILDPLRPEANQSVRSCQGAGVKVVMVTGDHRDTAAFLAKQCGILNEAEGGTVVDGSHFRHIHDAAFLAQHGTRLQRYVQREETMQGDEVISTLRPILDTEGKPEPWHRAIGPCCNKPAMHVEWGQKEKATYYEGFAPGLIKGVPPQLDMWAYGVANKYDPSRWSQEVQQRVESLRVQATEAYLHEHGEARAVMFQTVAKDADELSQAIADGTEGLKCDDEAMKQAAITAVQKLGMMVLPPADFKDPAIAGMSEKERMAIDGGPQAAKLWHEVDKMLYNYNAEGKRVQSGGLQVLARSLPDDKLKLVRRFMQNGEIVGVTGDGTNDAPALRYANVGMAMGSGTQAARDAADITILDNNFQSIVNAIKWGRNIFDNIRKFLCFQLTVNCVALTLTFVMACFVGDNVKQDLPLNAVMLLWVNLIMDSLGALALATEKPTDALLDRPPHGKERLISVHMIRMTLVQSVFQLIVLFVLSSSLLYDFCDGPNMWDAEHCDASNFENDETCKIRRNTLVFNTFVFCQFWNEINCRKLKEFNVFENYWSSPMFSAVLLFTFILQIIMVEAGSKGVGTNGLTYPQWGMSIAIGWGSLPVGFLARLIPIEALEEAYGQGADFGDEVLHMNVPQPALDSVRIAG